MKHKILLIFFAFLLSGLSLRAQFAGGDGTKANPYQISTVDQLNSARNYLSSHFVLTADIDLSSYSTWEPIGNYDGPFTGSFDGANHIISNFTSNSSSNSIDYLSGLFGLFVPATTGDSIQNLGMTQINISGSGYAAPIVGYVEGGTIYNCFAADGSITSDDSYVGGIAGFVAIGKISNCYSSLTIYAEDNKIGGIVGGTKKETITEKCFSASTITGTYSVGGIVGYQSSTGVSNCVALTPKIVKTRESSDYYYRISGCNYSATNENNFALETISLNGDIVVSNDATSPNGKDITFAIAKDSAFYKDYVNWDFNNLWTMDTSSISPYPILKAFSSDAQKVKHAQGIAWSQDLADVAMNDTIILTASAAGTITYSSSNPSIAKVSGDTLFSIGAGTTYIVASASATDYYEAATDSNKYVLIGIGSGTKDDPILIESLSQLELISYNLAAHYKLATDIDMSECSDWEPIGDDDNPFAGSFDGDNHILTNLDDCVFEYYQPAISGDSIKNLGLVDADVRSDGGIVETIIGGALYNCFCTGDSYTNGGGLVGVAKNSIIDNCYSTAIIETSLYGGGIVGELYSNSVVSNCYSASYIDLENNYAGGIAGAAEDSEIKNCIALNIKIDGDENINRLVGDTANATLKNNYGLESIAIKSKYVSGTFTDVNGNDATFTASSDSAFYKSSTNWETAWNFNSIWTMDTVNVSPYPILKSFDSKAQKVKLKQIITWDDAIKLSTNDTVKLLALGTIEPITYTSSDKTIGKISGDTVITNTIKSKFTITANVNASKFFTSNTVSKEVIVFEGAGTHDDPFLISSVKELDNVRYNMNAYYKLTTDIDLSSIDSWERIGTYDDPFMGSFDGDGHSIKNLTIIPDDNGIGLFGYIDYTDEEESNDTIKNLTFINPTISNDDYDISIMGVLAGKMQGGIITNCAVIGASITGDSNIGIFVGSMVKRGTICNSYSTQCAIEAGSTLGGIVGTTQGKNSDSIYIYNCFAIDGTIRSLYPEFYTACIGGIAGDMTRGVIKNCYSNVSIEAPYTPSTFGGIVGSIMYAQIKNCYSSSPIQTNNSNNESTGGIVGDTYNTEIINCVAANSLLVTGSDINRIVGYPFEWGVTSLENNYALDVMPLNDSIITNGTTTNKNGADTTLTALTDPEFYKQIMTWDFDNIWTMDTSSVSPYPVLKMFDMDIQTTKHLQEIYWGKDFSGYSAGDTVLLGAVGGVINKLYYEGNDTTVATISNDTMFIHSNGAFEVTAYVDSSKFFTADTLSRYISFYTTSGTKNDPYVITTASQLDAVRGNLTAHYKLGNDIDVNEYNWTAIGTYTTPFEGSFNGNGYIIKNLKIETEEVMAGLFGYYAPETDFDSICNLGVYADTVKGSDYCGIIVGYVDYGTVCNCFTSGYLTADAYAAGVVGFATSSEVSNCYSSANIDGYRGVGGVVGSSSYGNIKYNYATGYIAGYNNVGGIIGYSFYDEAINNNVAINAKLTTTTSIFEGSSYAGRVAGPVDGSDLANNYAWSNMYINNSIVSGSDTYNGKDTSISTIKSEDFYTTTSNWNSEAWDFKNTWEMNDTVSPYPILKNFEVGVQKLKHTQVITNDWSPKLPTNGTIGDTIILVHPAEAPGEKVAFASANASVAVVSNDSVFAKGLGTANILAFYPESEFYAASDSLSQKITIANYATDVPEIQNPSEQNLSVYPNPTNSLVTVSTNETILYIRIFTISGTMLLNQTGNGNNMELNLANLNNGVYLIQVETEDGISVKRVIKN